MDRRSPTALRLLLDSVIDWFIPEDVRSGDIDHLRRARLAVAFAGTLTLVAIPFCTFHVLVHSTFCATTVGVGICVGIGCLYTMRQTGSWILTGNLSAATVFGVLTVLAARLGGHDSMALPWYAVIPFVALMTTGRRSALCWVVVTWLSLTLFYGVEHAGYTFSNDLSPGQYAFLDLVSMTGLVLLLSGLAFLYETSKDQALSERREAEEQLAREKGISDSLIASLPGMFYLLDEKGRFVRWNENLECVSGYSGEELSQMKATDFFTDHDRELIVQRMKEVLKMGKSGTEANFQPKNGRAIPYLFSSRSVMIDGMPHLVGTGLDITARKRIEEALQASEGRFRQFAIASGYGLVMTELSGQLVFANNTILQMLDEDSIETLTNKTYRDYNRAEDAERIQKEIVATVLECGQWKGEILLVSAKGKLVPTEQSVFLIRDNQGKPRMLGAIVTDITERKRAEAALEKRIVALTRPIDDAEDLMLEELFNLEDIQRLQDEFAKATGVSSIITRTDGTPITAPSNFCRLCHDIIRGTDKGRADCFKSDARLGRLNPDGPTVQTCAGSGFREAGASITVGGKHIANWLIGQVRDSEQTEERIREYARTIGADEEAAAEALQEVHSMSREQFDNVAQALFTLAQQLSTTAYQNVQQARFITERNRSEAELALARDEAQAANQAKSEFLANMSHEIRTPMTAILGFADILMEGEMAPEQLDAATTIKHNGEYLLRLINDILDLSKIEAGKMKVEHILCSPQQILTDVMSLMRVRADAKNLALTVEYDGLMPKMIRSDPLRLRQILINLISNAIKFTEVGKVQVVTHLLDAESEEPRLQIEVTDSGIGISKEHMSRLFQPFSQGDSSSTRKHGGTGLGLAISKRLAQRLGGDIRAKSNVGEGCTFTVTVTTGPLERTEMVAPTMDTLPAASPRAVPQAAPTICDCRVLLAEDGPDNQRLIAFLLKKGGAEVVVVDNGRSACDLALSAQNEGCPFDVILMDMQMPIMDGYDATSKLRKKGYTGPIIALTAHAMSTDRDKCLQTGCDDYMTKPIDRERLTTLIGHYAARGIRETETC